MEPPSTSSPRSLFRLTRVAVTSKFRQRPVPIQFVVIFSTTVFGDYANTLFGAFFSFHTRRRRFSFFLHIGSIATYHIVSFRGEEFLCFCPNKHFVWCAVRAQHANTSWVVLCQRYSIWYVFNCVLISFVSVCLYVWWCVQGKPTEHSPSRCIRIVFCTCIRRTTGSCVEAPIRVPHDATECEGEVLNPCRAQEMTVTDTVCCSNVLCRSICHRSTQCEKTRVGAGFRS